MNVIKGGLILSIFERLMYSKMNTGLFVRWKHFRSEKCSKFFLFQPANSQKVLGHGYQECILRVFKVFREHPDISKKNFFSNFHNIFYFFAIFVINFFVQKVSFTIFPLKVIK